MVSKNEHHNRSLCPVALGLDIVGDHWTLLIVRDLLFGKHEFKEFLDSDEGISSNILTDRLNKLQAHHIVAWIHPPDSKKRKLYYLTQKGKDLVYVMVPLVHWSLKHRADEVVMSPPSHAAIDQGPAEFVESLLRPLSEWETSLGIDANAASTRL